MYVICTVTKIRLGLQISLLKGPSQPLFTCVNLAIIFYSEPVKTKKNDRRTTQDNETYLLEHSLQFNNKDLLHHVISILSMSSKMAEAD